MVSAQEPMSKFNERFIGLRTYTDSHSKLAAQYDLFGCVGGQFITITCRQLAYKQTDPLMDGLDTCKNN